MTSVSASSESLRRTARAWGRPGAITAILGCFLAQALIALTVVPPWQNPDEPQHLLTVRLVMRYGPNFDVDADHDLASEFEIVQSMGRYDWWRHYGRPTPSPLPATFASGPAHVIGDYFGPPGGGSRIYYRVIAAVFRLTRTTGLLPQLYTMRILSAGAALLTLVCIWMGTRLLLDAPSAVVVTTAAALVPQFVLVSTSASPDAFVNLAGAVVWWQAAVILTSQRLTSAVLLWAATIGGFLIRRMGAPLIAVSAILTAALVYRRARSWQGPGPRPWRITVLIALGAAVVLVLLQSQTELARALGWSHIDVRPALSAVIGRRGDLAGVVSGMFESFWLGAGWLQYFAPRWWYLVIAAGTAMAGVGLLRVSLMDWRHVFWLPAIMVLAQVVAAVVFDVGVMHQGVQGRYLFPVLGAVLSLVWAGFRIWFRPVRQARAAVALTMAVVFLNATAWLLVILPAYV